MNILAIGDVVGSVGCKFLRARLPAFKKLKDIHLVIANGENSADGNGLTPTSANYLFDSGVDVITSGNHIYRRREIYDYLDDTPHVLRPANYPKGTPGTGVCICDLGRTQVAVINLMGAVFIENFACPFETLDAILAQDLPAIKILDFHAEATGEKRALGFYADGRITAMFGTHTHVPTADEGLLPQGTGYISDAGMTGVIQSALGVRPDIVIQKFRTKMPVRFENATGPCKMDCVLFSADEKTGRCLAVERFSVT